MIDKSTSKYIIFLIIEIGLLIRWLYIITIDELKSSFFVVLLFLSLILYTGDILYKSLLRGLVKKRLKKSAAIFSERLCKIKILQPPVQTSPLMKYDDVVVLKSPYSQQCKCIETSELLILFFKLRCCFGIFYTEVFPIVLKKNGSAEKLPWFKKKRVFNLSDTYFEKDDLVIRVGVHINNIHTIIIIGYKNIFD